MADLDMTLGEIAELIGRSRLVGDAGFRCRAILPLDLAGPDDLAFVRDSDPRASAEATDAGALIVAAEIPDFDRPQLVVPEPMLALVRLLAHLARGKRELPRGVDPRALVDESAELGSDVVVGPGAVICAEARIGDRAIVYSTAYIGARSIIGAESVVHPNVSIMEDVTIGERVIVHPGAVVGGDGYGFVAQGGEQLKVPQVGEVVIGDDVEIGSCATIDRATLAATRVGRGTKIGDLVHIAHNVQIGEDCLLLPTVAVSGSTTIGDRVVFAGRAACADQLTIGDDAVLGATTVAYKDVEPGAVLWGNPARDKTTEMRIQSLLPTIPEMARELRRLRRLVEKLTHNEE